MMSCSLCISRDSSMPTECHGVPCILTANPPCQNIAKTGFGMVTKSRSLVGMSL